MKYAICKEREGKVYVAVPGDSCEGCAFEDTSLCEEEYTALNEDCAHDGTKFKEVLNSYIRRGSSIYKPVHELPFDVHESVVVDMEPVLECPNCGAEVDDDTYKCPTCKAFPWL